MADIIVLNTAKQPRLPRKVETERTPFQLLFFTGVRYERYEAPSYTLKDIERQTNMPAARKSVRVERLLLQ
jgi:hypothetical protein